MINSFKRINENKVIGSVIRGLIISLLITLLFILVLSFILVKTSISESIITPSIYGITCLSILIGTAVSIKNNGVANGSIVGIVYILLLYTLSSISNGDFGLTSNSFALILVSIISGGIGGILGANFKRM